MLKINTLDLDWNDKHRLGDVVCKIMLCPDMVGLKSRWSASLNGFHLEFWCSRKCDLCRLVFDDQERYSRDLRRPERTRDVLWCRKSFKKAGSIIVLET